MLVHRDYRAFRETKGCLVLTVRKGCEGKRVFKEFLEMMVQLELRALKVYPEMMVRKVLKDCRVLLEQPIMQS
jgi:hypothetical protein